MDKRQVNIPEIIAVNFVYTSLQNMKDPSYIRPETHNYDLPLTVDAFVKLADMFMQNGTFNRKSYIPYRKLVRIIRNILSIPTHQSVTDILCWVSQINNEFCNSFDTFFLHNETTYKFNYVVSCVGIDTFRKNFFNDIDSLLVLTSMIDRDYSVLRLCDRIDQEIIKLEEEMYFIEDDEEEE